MIKDHKVDPNAGVAVLPVIFQVDGVPISQSGIEFRSYRLPSNTDWELVDAYVHARAVAATQSVKLQDDGSDITSATAAVAGAQTAMTLSSTPTKIKGGSELQLVVTTNGSGTIDDLTVSVRLRPLYTYGRAATGVPS